MADRLGARRSRGALGRRGHRGDAGGPCHRVLPTPPVDVPFITRQTARYIDPIRRFDTTTADDPGCGPMIDTAILGLLKDQDLHGYELRKRLDELPGSRATVSFGSLYPALGRLEKAGFVK